MNYFLSLWFINNIYYNRDIYMFTIVKPITKDMELNNLLVLNPVTVGNDGSLVLDLNPDTDGNDGGDDGESDGEEYVLTEFDKFCDQVIDRKKRGDIISGEKQLKFLKLLGILICELKLDPENDIRVSELLASLDLAVLTERAIMDENIALSLVEELPQSEISSMVSSIASHDIVSDQKAKCATIVFHEDELTIQEALDKLIRDIDTSVQQVDVPAQTKMKSLKLKSKLSKMVADNEINIETLRRFLDLEDKKYLVKNIDNALRDMKSSEVESVGNSALQQKKEASLTFETVTGRDMMLLADTYKSLIPGLQNHDFTKETPSSIAAFKNCIEELSKKVSKKSRILTNLLAFKKFLDSSDSAYMSTYAKLRKERSKAQKQGTLEIDELTSECNEILGKNKTVDQKRVVFLREQEKKAILQNENYRLEMIARKNAIIQKEFASKINAAFDTFVNPVLEILLSEAEVGELVEETIKIRECISQCSQIKHA